MVHHGVLPVPIADRRGRSLPAAAPLRSCPGATPGRIPGAVDVARISGVVGRCPKGSSPTCAPPCCRGVPSHPQCWHHCVWFNDSALEHRSVGFQVLSDGLETELVEAAERGQAGRMEVGRDIKVFPVGSVGTSIFRGAPTPYATATRSTDYTLLVREEPDISGGHRGHRPADELGLSPVAIGGGDDGAGDVVGDGGAAV